jgi:hypothetical protein
VTKILRPLVLEARRTKFLAAACLALGVAAACTSTPSPEAESVGRTASSLAFPVDAGIEASTPTCSTSPEAVTWDPTTASSLLTVDSLFVSDTVQQQRGSARTTGSRCAGKWYWEIEIDEYAGATLDYPSYPMIGVGDANAPLSGSYVGGTADSWSYYPPNAEKYNDSGAGNFGPYGTIAGVGDVIGVALDIDDGTLTFYEDGVSLGVAFTNIPSGIPLYPMVGTAELYFGATARFAAPFAYPPPDGYSAFGGVAPASTCTATSGTTTIDATTARGVVTSSVAGVPGVSQTSTSVITVDGVLYRQVRLTNGGEDAGVAAVTIDATYGPLVQGVQQVHLQSSDGTTYTGTVDGRAVAPFVPSSTAPAYVFTDGLPAPTVVVSADTQAQVDALVTAAASTQCPTSTSSATAAIASASRRTATALRTEGRPVRLSPQGTGNDDIPVPVTDDDFNAAGSASCSNCTNGCTVGAIACQAGALVSSATCAWFAEICAAAGYATCVVAAETCLGNITSITGCNGNGGACHPGNVCGDGTVCSNSGDSCTPGGDCCNPNNVICGNDCCKAGIFGCNQGTCCPQETTPCGRMCCGAGEECATTAGFCCAVGTTACGVSCCGAGEICGDPKSGLCCPTGQVASNGICCLAGMTECNGACCASGDCQGGAESPSGELCCGSKLCGGQCCDGAAGGCVNGTCCWGGTDSNGNCCPLGDSVVNGACCANGQACGSACCASGNSCLNAATSQCGIPPNTCTGGNVPCIDGNVSYCCAPDQSCDSSLSGCCGGVEGPSCVIK